MMCFIPKSASFSFLDTFWTSIKHQKLFKQKTIIQCEKIPEGENKEDATFITFKKDL